ncbi:GNAT family N-acetyltransferase [Viridibacterium curvum]|uniref:GNAT family N-acetyltransferase n=1 Tax=Viridibacterium curvum TaxID=1101404 RepID=A0ABP9QNM7_9RHOO
MEQMTPSRLATPADAEEIAALVNRAYRPAACERTWTHEADLIAGERIAVEQVRTLFRPQSRVLLQCRASAILACVHLEIVGAVAHIGMLATRPDVQAQGLGKHMLAQAERHAHQYFRVESFEISVLTARTELLSFYERRGYVRTGRRLPYPADSGTGQPLREDIELELLSKTAHRNLYAKVVDGRHPA